MQIASEYLVVDPFIPELNYCLVKEKERRPIVSEIHYEMIKLNSLYIGFLFYFILVITEYVDHFYRTKI